MRYMVMAMFNGYLVVDSYTDKAMTDWMGKEEAASLVEVMNQTERAIRRAREKHTIC